MFVTREIVSWKDSVGKEFMILAMIEQLLLECQ